MNLEGETWTVVAWTAHDCWCSLNGFQLQEEGHRAPGGRQETKAQKNEARPTDTLK
jgi:hypothetical protein